MTHSMTAFARQDISADWGNASWEIRSVNQRYLETYFRLPDQFRHLEPILRERLRTKLQRGKIEIHLRFSALEQQTSLDINRQLAKQVIEQATWVLNEAGTGQLNPLDILKWPGVIATTERDMTLI